MVGKISGSRTNQFSSRMRDAQMMAGLGVVLLALHAMVWVCRPVTWLLAYLFQQASSRMPVSHARCEMAVQDNGAYRETMLKRVADDQR